VKEAAGGEDLRRRVLGIGRMERDPSVAGWEGWALEKGGGEGFVKDI